MAAAVARDDQIGRKYAAGCQPDFLSEVLRLAGFTRVGNRPGAGIGDLGRDDLPARNKVRQTHGVYTAWQQLCRALSDRPRTETVGAIEIMEETLCP